MSPHDSYANALRLRLSNERCRLANAKTDQERELRKVWVMQTEKELSHELRHHPRDDMTDAELLAALDA